MKKILLVLTFLLCASLAHAQYTTPSERPTARESFSDAAGTGAGADVITLQAKAHSCTFLISNTDGADILLYKLMVGHAANGDPVYDGTSKAEIPAGDSRSFSCASDGIIIVGLYLEAKTNTASYNVDVLEFVEE